MTDSPDGRLRLRLILLSSFRSLPDIDVRRKWIHERLATDV